MAIDKILNKTISIDAPTSEVWNALTNPDLIKEWLFGTKVISDWKVGASILFTGNWQETDYADKGTILKFDIEKVFQYNYWSVFSGLSDSPRKLFRYYICIDAEWQHNNIDVNAKQFSN